MKQSDKIENKIFSIRSKQVMLDRDLADIYQTDTRTLKQAVKRNAEKFPPDFMIELDENDIESLVSQSVIPSRSFLGGALPYAFTEPGVAMLASVIKTEKAIRISIKVIRAFVEMRRMITDRGNFLNRITTIEKKQMIHDRQFEKIFRALENKNNMPTQGVFFNGQVFDAYKFAADIIRKARQSIVLIDNYVDDITLQIFTKRKAGIPVFVYTKKISGQLQLDAEKFNDQYGPLYLRKLANNHDRFLIIDRKEMYHIGASLKDLGKKIFAFSKMDTQAIILLSKLQDPEKGRGELI